MIVIVVAFALAAQDPPVPPARVQSVTGETSMFADAKDVAAAGACTCEAGGCRCNPAALARYDSAFTTTTEHAADVTAVARPVFAKDDAKARRCIVGYEVVISSREHDIVVDWSRVSILVDNVAQPAVPSYARVISSALVQRSVTAPAGTAVKEVVFPIPGANVERDTPELERCIASSDRTLGLSVPFRVGGEEDRMAVVTTTHAISTTESAALDDLAEPQVHMRDRLNCFLLGRAPDDAEVAVHSAWEKRHGKAIARKVAAAY